MQPLFHRAFFKCPFQAAKLSPSLAELRAVFSWLTMALRRLKLEELSSVVDRLQAREPPQHLRPGAEEMGIYESCVSGLPELKPKSNQELAMERGGLVE